MAIDRSGPWWKGDAAADIGDYLKTYEAGGYPVAQVRIVESCGVCSSTSGFRLTVDDEEGFACRTCADCGAQHLMLDSSDVAEDAEPEAVACPSGHEVFDVAVGYALREDGDVRWVSLGLRCREDRVPGCYADWKIDYAPTDHLLTSA